jgi:hypothetical protein
MALAGGISVPHNHLDAIYFQMVCVSCDEHYNLGSRRPKILGCGHTFSLDCLQNQLVRQGKIECQVCAVFSLRHAVRVVFASIRRRMLLLYFVYLVIWSPFLYSI